MVCTSGCRYSYKLYSWWWVCKTLETCSVNPAVEWNWLRIAASIGYFKESHDNIHTNSLIINITKCTFHLFIQFLLMCPLSNNPYIKIHKLDSKLSFICPCVCLSLYWNITDWSYVRRKSYGQKSELKKLWQGNKSKYWIRLDWKKYLHIHSGLKLSEEETTWETRTEKGIIWNGYYRAQKLVEMDNDRFFWLAFLNTVVSLQVLFNSM